MSDTPLSDASACDGWSGDACCISYESAQAIERLIPKWQPIETAPKDGTSVLLFKQSMDFKIRGYGYWEGGDSFVSGWISKGFDDTFGNLGLANPSHWMPLPEPPK